MDTIPSADGTRIAYARGGSGRPLVLVHGTAADHRRWQPVLPALQARYDVYAIDRRGRGGSGDGASYQLEREFEDVAAVVEDAAHAAGQQADLLGHSHGALVALEAARLTPQVRRLILYEPPIWTEGVEVYPPEVLSELEALNAAVQLEAVAATFLAKVALVPPESLARLKADASWPGGWRRRTPFRARCRRWRSSIDLPGRDLPG